MSWLRDYLGPDYVRHLVFVHTPPRRCARCRRLAMSGERFCFRHLPTPTTKGIIPP